MFQAEGASGHSATASGIHGVFDDMSETPFSKFMAAIDAQAVFLLVVALTFSTLYLGFHRRRPDSFDVENGDEPQVVAAVIAITVAFIVAYCIAFFIQWFRDRRVQIDGSVATTLQKVTDTPETDDQALVPRIRHDGSVGWALVFRCNNWFGPRSQIQFFLCASTSLQQRKIALGRIFGFTNDVNTYA